jgi:urease accessory protein
MTSPKSAAFESVRNANAAGRGWSAELALNFAQRDGQTFLAGRRHSGPLLVQRPFFPEPAACHVYIVHPPGGIVGGDELSIEVTASAGSHAVLTTPAATKLYRSDAKLARQHQRFDVQSAICEWLPQETIFYRDARARSDAVFKLDAMSRLIAWEIPCLGLPARAEPFNSGALQLGLEVWVDSEPRFIDRLRIDGAAAARSASWGLASYDAIGTLLAYPANAAIVTAVRQLELAGVELAVTLVDEVLVCRCLSAQAETVKRAFIAVWRSIRPQLLGREAVLPRIWAT